MTLEELKSDILEEHRRDVRLTILGFLLVVLFLGVLFALVTFLSSSQLVAEYISGLTNFFNPETNPSANYYRIALAALLLGGLGYFVFRVVQLSKRTELIDKFFDEVQNGAVATHISEVVVYKIKLPLLKIKLNLCPVNFAQINLVGSTKLYKLPIKIALVPELKTHLSGVNAESVGSAWHELYADISSDVETSETTSLKSTEEVNEFVQNNLISDIESVEQGRKKGVNRMVLYSIPTVLIILGWIYFQYMMSQGLQVNPYLLIGVFIGISVVFSLVSLAMRNRSKNKTTGQSYDFTFKTKIFSKLIEFVNPNFKYVMHGHISAGEFLEMGFFENKHYDISGNDQIIGKHSGVPFQLCDLNVHRKRNFTKENSAPDEVFYGQVFIARFNKTFKNEVYVVPKKLEGFFSKSDASLHFDYLGEKVELEDPEFMKMFNVYSHDQIEARYILSTSLMDRLKQYQQKHQTKLMVSFRNNRISVANYSRKNNFELSMLSSVTKNNLIEEFYKDLRSQLEIIDTLKLNINIWKS